MAMLNVEFGSYLACAGPFSKGDTISVERE
jgi:hypothetical protein